MVSTEAEYTIARLPIDAVKGAGQLAAWPIHFGKTLYTNSYDTAFKALGVDTVDVPGEGIPAGVSVYDVAKTNLDMAAMIYYYAEIRSETKRLLQNFATEKGMTHEMTDPNVPSDLVLLQNAIVMTEKGLQAIQSTPENTDSTEALKTYQEMLAGLADLSKRFMLTTGDVEVFKSYFEILRNPTDMAAVYSDLVRYDKFVDPQFRLAFGGTEFNRKNVEDMIGPNNDTFIYHIDDDFTSSSMDIEGVFKGIYSELVWAIVITKSTKKITVVFRGSTNLQDWVHNVSGNMVDCKFPGYTTDQAEKEPRASYGRVHEGFYSYLTDKTKPGRDGSTKSKGEEIVGMLKGLFEQDEYADYDLVVTGHSLGGSMSTMFAYRCACLEDDFPGKMITNVSFASPFVGGPSFRSKFIELERKKKIKHLRVSNYQDVVPLIPACSFPLPNGVEFYKHVGMNIRLYEGGDLAAPNYRRFYPKEGSLLNGVRNAMHTSIPLGLSVGIIGKHLCGEYHKRLTYKDTKEELEKLTLDDLYATKDIVGWEYYE